MKYEIGDYVSKPVTGVCRVEDILHLDMAGIKNDKLYYLLIPIDSQQEKIYVPVVTADSSLRACMTSEEAWKFIEHISEIEAIWIDNEKKREQKYKEAIKTNCPEALISVIKMIYQRKKMRLEQGKKSTASDERYFQIAEKLLYSELGLALKKPKQEICQLIVDFIEQKGAEDKK